MFKKVEAVFLWVIGVLLIYGAIAVLYYGFYILFWAGPLEEVYAGEFRQILSLGPGLALMILAVIMVFIGKVILTKKNEIEKELAEEKVSREKETLIKETLKNKVAPYLSDENREKLWEDRFDENDPEINFETIDLLLEPTSAHRANSFAEEESKYDIETIDLSLGQLSMDRANGFDEDDTDLDLAPADQTPEYMSPYPKKNPDEDDTDLEYPEEE
ncbi:MAG: hypothetical protein JSU67_18585 [Gammaproteobacteria bacterium]|nr:MAG: hypothetical protein JSU67_18585 [Gammaproteobacteria bacterium]